jgi:hypothetical protein
MPLPRLTLVFGPPAEIQGRQGFGNTRRSQSQPSARQLSLFALPNGPPLKQSMPHLSLPLALDVACEILYLIF